MAAAAPATVRYSDTVRGGERVRPVEDLGSVNPTAVGTAFHKIYGAGANAATAPSESNTTHAGLNVLTLANAQFGADAASEAFDEPLDRAHVVAIVQGFFIPSIS